MAVIFPVKTSSGRIHYYGDLSVKGKRYRRYLGLSKKTAELALKELEYTLRFGVEEQEVSNMPYSEAILKFLVHVELSGTGVAQVSYIASGLRGFERFLIKRSKMKMNEVTKDDCRDYMKMRSVQKLYNFYNPEKSDDWKYPEISTINRDISQQRRFFRFCMDNDWTSDNPWLSIPRIKDQSAKTPRYSFSNQELESIFQVAGRFYDFYYLLLHTGIRATDAFVLQASAFNGSSISIVQRKTGDWLQNIPVPEHLIEQLKDRIKCGGLVFPELSTDRQRRLSRKHIQSIFEPNFVRENHINLHTFRHTYAHRMLDRGVPKEVLQTFMGHRSIRTTEIYANWVSDSELKKWVE